MNSTSQITIQNTGNININCPLNSVLKRNTIDNVGIFYSFV